MSLTFDNPYSLLTHTVPPKNNLLCWDYGLTYSAKTYPAASILFSDVNLLLIPNCDERESSFYMRKIYATEIRDNFRAIDTNLYWTLYRKD